MELPSFTYHYINVHDQISSAQVGNQTKKGPVTVLYSLVFTCSFNCIVGGIACFVPTNLTPIISYEHQLNSSLYLTKKTPPKVRLMVLTFRDVFISLFIYADSYCNRRKPNNNSERDCICVMHFRYIVAEIND